MPRDADGHFLSWDDALDLREDPEAIAAAVEGQAWAAWLLDLLEGEEREGSDAAGFDSFGAWAHREFEEAYFEEEPEYEEDLDDRDLLDEGDELELTADAAYEEGET